MEKFRELRDAMRRQLNTGDELWISGDGRAAIIRAGEEADLIGEDWHRADEPTEAEMRHRNE